MLAYCTDPETYVKHDLIVTNIGFNSLSNKNGVKCGQAPATFCPVQDILFAKFMYRVVTCLAVKLGGAGVRGVLIRFRIVCYQSYYPLNVVLRRMCMVNTISLQKVRFEIWYLVAVIFSRWISFRIVTFVGCKFRTLKCKNFSQLHRNTPQIVRNVFSSLTVKSKSEVESQRLKW